MLRSRTAADRGARRPPHTVDQRRRRLPRSGGLRLFPVAAESTLEQVEGLLTLCTQFSRQTGVAGSGEDSPAEVVDQAAVNAHERVGGDPGSDIVDRGPCLVGDEGGKRPRVTV